VGPQIIKKRLLDNFLKAFFYGLRAFKKLKKGTSNEIIYVFSN
jgi:hypothetical protein